MTVALATVVSVLVALTPGSGQIRTNTGSLAGCVSDQAGQRLPGATIVAKRPSAQRTTQTDASGCFELRDLESGPYRVTTRLRGFDNVTRDAVPVAPATATRLDLATQVSAICECVRFERTLLDHWRHADRVLHVRVLGPDARPAPAGGFYRHAAAVLTDLKPSVSGRARNVAVVQNQRSGAPDPYDVGLELVLFLESSDDGAFRVTNDDPGLTLEGKYPAMAFAIRDRRVQYAPPEFAQFEGMALQKFLEQVRSIAQSR